MTLSREQVEAYRNRKCDCDPRDYFENAPEPRCLVCQICDMALRSSHPESREQAPLEAELFTRCDHCDDGTEPHTDNDVTGPQACSKCKGHQFIPYAPLRGAAQAGEQESVNHKEKS